jgi:hypothetical protein
MIMRRCLLIFSCRISRPRARFFSSNAEQIVHGDVNILHSATASPLSVPPDRAGK